MSTPTNIPKTPMGETEQDSYPQTEGEISTAASGHLPVNPEGDWARSI